MTRFFLAFFVILVLVLLGFPFFYLQNPYKTATTSSDKWYDFSAPKDVFSVKFPLEPHHSTLEIIDRHYEVYASETTNGSIFMVSLIEFTEGKEPLETYKKSIINDLLVSDPQNQIKSMKVGSYHLFPTIDFVITGPMKTLNGRTFSDGNVIYLLTGIFNNATYDERQYNYFINSFEWRAPR